MREVTMPTAIMNEPTKRIQRDAGSNPSDYLGVIMAKAILAVDRFLQKVERIPFSGCWIWMGNTSNGRYGSMWYEGKNHGAHRMSWALFYGNIPEGFSVLHRCDVMPCVNPNHLFLGTQKDNVIDCWNKGRHDPVPNSVRRGLENNNVKLNDEKVMEIRRKPFVPAKEIAKKLGVHWSLIYQIRRGYPWAES